MKPAKIVRIFLVFFTALVLCASIGAALFIKLYPKERLLGLVIAKAEFLLKRKVSVKNIGYSLGGIFLEEVVIHEGGSDNSPVLAASEYADLRFSLISLLALELDFDKISLENAFYNIVFDDKGESNIQKLVSTFSREGDSSFSAKISNIALSGAIISLKNPPKLLAPLAGTYRVSGKIQVGKGVRIHDCTVTLPQSRGRLHPDLIIEFFKDTFRISGSVGLENASLPWVYQWGENVSLPYNILNGKVTDLVITKQYVKGRADATSTLLNSNRLVRAEGLCNVDIDAGTVHISQTKGGVDNSSFFIENLRFSFDGKLSSFGVRNASVALTDVMPLLKFIPPKLFGTVEGDLSLANGLYNGNLSVSGCGWDPDLKIVNDLQATLYIRDNVFKKADIPLTFYGNPCTLSIASTERDLSKLYVNVSSGRIVLDPARDKFSASGEPLNLPLQISGSITVEQLLYKPYTLSEIQLLYQASGNRLAITGFQFMFAGGTVTGTGAAGMTPGAPQASCALKFDNLSVQDIISSNEKIRNRFFGVLQGNSKINFELGSRFQQTATGNVEFTIDKGKLVDTGIQDGLGLLLAELRYKLRDLEFNKIYGNIDIRGTTYRIKSFIFNSNDIRLKITGSFDQNLTATPLNIDLEFTRAFIQDLPGASAFIYNKYLRGEWYIVPFIMNGDMTDSKNVKRLN
ncbi:MAG: hypothetical protein A2W19_05190 [Spirochaetes bacterium RBG_16_49_21]|nr:MAG: hypothetical protein A2W19_05190 [Spirochaetes bacterium RBG_16_49_21]